MDRKREMMQAEDERHHELHELIAGLSPEQMEQGGINADGWTVKDLLWHLGAWNAESARELERIQMGTYEDRDYDTDEMNSRFMEAGRLLDLETVKTEWLSSRNRVLTLWDSMPEITPEAEEWFYESGAAHMDEHLPELRDWLEKQA